MQSQRKFSTKAETQHLLHRAPRQPLHKYLCIQILYLKFDFQQNWGWQVEGCWSGGREIAYETRLNSVFAQWNRSEQRRGYGVVCGVLRVDTFICDSFGVQSLLGSNRSIWIPCWQLIYIHMYICICMWYHSLDLYEGCFRTRETYKIFFSHSYTRKLHKGGPKRVYRFWATW